MIRLFTMACSMLMVAPMLHAREIVVEPDSGDGKPIAAALQQAKPGDVVTLQGGTYREAVKAPAGEPEKPITLRGADGERVIITGMAAIDGWEAGDGGVYTVTVYWKPDQLYVADRPLTKARTPDEGFWIAEGGGDNTLTDAANLRNLKTDPTGGTLRVWAQRGNTFLTVPISKYDPAAGTITLDPGEKGKPAKLQAGDRYFLTNRPDYVDQPGEWSVTPASGTGVEAEAFLLHVMPHDAGDVKSLQAPRLGGQVVLLNSHTRLEGIEVSGGTGHGVQAQDATDVVVQRCILHHNEEGGITFRDVENGIARNNIVWHNGHGIRNGGLKHGLVVNNDVGYSGADGVLVAWKSEDVEVRGNYIHDHLLWDHPDGLQAYRDVTDLRILDNLITSSGQSVMMEEAIGGTMAGNTFVGSAAVMAIFGHGNTHDWSIHNNTFFLSGYSALSLTGRGYDIRENIFVTGQPSVAYEAKAEQKYTGDRNLIWSGGRSHQVTVATDKGRAKSIDDAREATGQDAESVNADPRFRNAPVAIAVLDNKKTELHTRDTLHIRDRMAPQFRKDDYVEVNFDGIPRQITAIDGAAFTIRPALDKVPERAWLVVNWGDQQDFTLDLRLKPGSPAAELAEDSGPVGSTLDIAAYHAGDFDGDGQRDLPDLPESIFDGIETRY